MIDQIHSDEELRELVEKLNAVTNEYFQWEPTRARKNHEDLFGDIIEARETYYKRSYGAAYHEVIKISKRSMDSLLFAIFAGNCDLKIIGEHFKKERFEKLRETMNKLSFEFDNSIKTDE